MQPDICYHFHYADGREETIALCLDPENGELLFDPDYIPPTWAALGFRQCSHCPLQEDELPHCPIARNIAWLFHERNMGASHSPVALTVSSGQRTYQFDTTVQRALSSLFGLICSLSPCPHTLPLRPMGIFHLPLSTEMETLVRISSLFLLRSYLSHKDNPQLPVDLSDMSVTYENLAILNRGMAERLRAASPSDAAVNAIALLDVLVKDVRVELDSQLELLKKMMGL